MNNESVTESKVRAEVKKLQIENDRATKRLVEKSLVKAAIEDIGLSMRKAFEDLPRTQAIKIAKIFELPDWANVIEKVLAKNIEDAIKEIIEEMKEKIKTL